MSEKTDFLLDFLFVVIVSDCFSLLLVSHSSFVLKLRLTSSFDNHSMFYFPEGVGKLLLTANPVRAVGFLLSFSYKSVPS